MSYLMSSNLEAERIREVMNSSEKREKFWKIEATYSAVWEVGCESFSGPFERLIGSLRNLVILKLHWYSNSNFNSHSNSNSNSNSPIWTRCSSNVRNLFCQWLPKCAAKIIFQPLPPASIEFSPRIFLSEHPVTGNEESKWLVETKIRNEESHFQRLI